MANQPRFFPNLSQESSHLEQQQPLCAFHTGSEKENIHTSKELCAGCTATQHSAEQMKNTVGSCWSAAAPNFHQWLSLLCICTFHFSPPAPLPSDGPCTGKSSKSREGHQKGTYTRKEQAAIGSYSLIKPHKFSPTGKWWEDANSSKTLKLSWHTAPVQKGCLTLPLEAIQPSHVLNSMFNFPRSLPIQGNLKDLTLRTLL